MPRLVSNLLNCRKRVIKKCGMKRENEEMVSLWFLNFVFSCLLEILCIEQQRGFEQIRNSHPIYLSVCAALLTFISSLHSGIYRHPAYCPSTSSTLPLFPWSSSFFPDNAQSMFFPLFYAALLIHFFCTTHAQPQNFLSQGKLDFTSCEKSSILALNLCPLPLIKNGHVVEVRSVPSLGPWQHNTTLSFACNRPYSNQLQQSVCFHGKWEPEPECRGWALFSTYQCVFFFIIFITYDFTSVWHALRNKNLVKQSKFVFSVISSICQKFWNC